MTNVHFDSEGFLRTARHEGTVARFMKKPVCACPYRGGIVEQSWVNGWETAYERMNDPR